ncbi:FkbM family methyltransferase [Bradyrhizobium sp. LB11.1]|jgi:FkbM family methyltransferase|uniref:FkbM family methyltransferase n=1 Tax=Bradyrhizobium sp. LB11.1 TaxID=3156326 RepID=UPI003393242D
MPIIALRRIEVFVSAICVLGFIGACMASLRRAFAKDRANVVQLRLRSNNEPIFLRIGSSDWEVLKQVYFLQEYAPPSEKHEEGMRCLYNRMLAEGRTPCILDCGANIGIASLWYSKQYPQAKIIAIEPEPSNFRVLQMNAQNHSNILPVQAAISDRISSVSLQNNDGGASWSWQTIETENGSTPTVTVESLIAEIPDAALLAVKIDIEGFETELMRSNTQWCDTAPLIVFESHDWKLPWSGSAHSFFVTLTKQKRDFLQRGENTFSYSHSLVQP